MDEITLQALLEAGCHFGHKSERWHPKASEFIYTEKDGIHIIDLAKTKSRLEQAAEFIRDTVAAGGEVIFVGTKRQAQGVVKEEATAVGAPYFVERWIGGFLTNWESVKKNIDKINRLTEEEAAGAWKKFPKHEQSKLSRYLKKLKVYYGGVLQLKEPPQAIFIIDIRKEVAATAEATRMGIPTVAIVDTNTDPTGITYHIPANDDAVGSIQYVTHVLAMAYAEGKTLLSKTYAEAQPQQMKQVVAEEVLKQTKKDSVEKEPSEAEKTAPKPASAKATVGKKRGRPKKIV